MNFQPPQTTVQGYPVQTTGYLPRSIQALQALTVWRDEHVETQNIASLQWLRQDICKAFQYLVGLRFGNTPAVEMLPITAEMWVEIVGEGMNEEQDRERIRAGFKQLRRELKWWPQPADLLKVLPRRTVAQQTCEVSKTSQVSEEEHARSSKAFEEILASLSDGMKVKSTKPLDRQGVEQMKREFMNSEK